MATDATAPNSTVVTRPSTSQMQDAGARSAAQSPVGLADNFQTFLTMLTTQLKNQNPLDPLGVNQFTQQLVQFAQVEQQLKGNNLLATLVSTQRALQSTQALAFVGTTAVVEGSSAMLARGSALWTMRAPKGVEAAVAITNAAGQTVYSGNLGLKAGENSFVWDGRSNDGGRAPDGRYRLTVSAKDGSGQRVAISTETQGTVDSVDLSASPVLLSIGGESYTVDKIKRVVRSSSAGVRNSP